MNDLDKKTTEWWKLNQASRGQGDDKAPTVKSALDTLNDILDTTGSHRLLATKAEQMKADIVIGPKRKGRKS